MKAIVKHAAEKGVEMVEKPLPEIGINDVLIKIKKTAICGTDVHIYEWNEWAQATIKPPMTIGHEYVGEVVDVGSNVRSVKVGDRVSGEGHIVCGHCRNCRAGLRHLCRETKGVGVNRDGAFAEYLAIPESNVWPCDLSIPDEVYAIFDPFGNATHTALSFNMVGEDVLITGAGPIGCMAAAIAKYVGARNVVMVDINDYRLSLAARLGATRTINSKVEDLGEVMKSLGMVEGFDVGLEMSGAGPCLNRMIELMNTGGRIALLGIHGPDTRVNWNDIVLKGLKIKGIYGREMFETWYKMGAMIQGGLDISPVITHRFSCQDYEKGFEAMISGQSGKVVLDWE
jgi:threonine 3-dehydrogenase